MNVAPAPLAHLIDPAGRLQRPDQDSGRTPLGLGHEVQQAVDPVGEVDVGVARRAEEDLVAGGPADVGVASGVRRVIRLGLDDHSGCVADGELAADQLARDLVHGAVEELAVHARRAVSASRARSSCSLSRPDAVPPAEIFDSIV